MPAQMEVDFVTVVYVVRQMEVCSVFRMGWYCSSMLSSDVVKKCVQTIRVCFDLYLHTMEWWF